MLSLTEKLLQIWKWCPQRERGMVSVPICANKVRMVQPVVTKAVLQTPKAPKAAAMCMVMRTLVTDTVRLCHTDLAVIRLWHGC